MLLAEVNQSGATIQAIRERGLEIHPAIDLRVGTSRIAVLIPKSYAAFEAMNRWVSWVWRAAPSPETLGDAQMIHPELAIVYSLSCMPIRPLRENEWVGVEVGEQVRAQSRPNRDKHLAWCSMYFRDSSDRNAHCLLRAIDQNALLSQLTSEDVLPAQHRWESLSSVELRFDRALWRRSCQFLDGLPSWDIDFGEGGSLKNLRHYTGSAEKDRALLRMLCEDALPYRYPQASQEIRTRLDKELSLIEQKGFISYFLINWDIIRYAQKQDFFYVGRGSGANSVVAYLLQITHVDPIELELYFERFINLYRQSPPDFDIDFSWRDRPRMTEYIFNRYPNVALLGAMNTFQYRAVTRELGKVFGMPKVEIDLLTRGKVTRGDALAERVLKYSQRLQGLPNHMSLHSSGILISERPLASYSTAFMPPKGYQTVDFDMYSAEDIGLHKFDILGQRGLSKITETLEIIRAAQPKEAPPDIHNIPMIKSDPKSLKLLMTGGAMACFYVESPAMRMLMTKLRTQSYLELVAASSVIRPGVAQSGMMKTYIDRHRNPDRRREAHPILQDIMPETYGVMVYQEDVIRVAHIYAGLTLGEADVLRRGMSGKFRSRAEFQQVAEKFMSNCREKGHPEVEFREIWRQIESFAGYAFAKGHSASYAVESFQCLFLKAHYPLAFLVATVNNGGGYYRAETYLQEARRLGAVIESPCVNEGQSSTLLTSDRRIILGTQRIREINHEFCQRIDIERAKSGEFIDLEDFMCRMHGSTHKLHLDQLLLLIRADAFRFTQVPKKELLWAAHRRYNPAPPQALSMFRQTRQFKLPSLSQSALEDAHDQLDLLGFPLCNPFNLYTGWREACGVAAAEWPRHVGRRVQCAGYLVVMKDTRTHHGEWMQFGTFQDSDGDVFDTVHFPEVTRKYGIRGRRGVFVLSGVLTSEYDHISLEVDHVSVCEMLPNPKYADDPQYQIEQMMRRRQAN